ncbi:class E sortase [Streptomyces sp. TRM76323]|uniref:Class E sortase n=1 Tax=Streptomyces tamarix TaxID=3078565 RepID=A0ABU3QS94_9ACTN|nr:class E sortase [Streptomyces tamarix]MDT9685562.1 class E sortase [Streptomyces tamarix]
MPNHPTVPALLAAVVGALVGCSAGPAPVSGDGRPAVVPAAVSSANAQTTPAAPTTVSVTAPTAVGTVTSTALPSVAVEPPPEPSPSKGDARTRPALLTIPEIGLEDLRVVPYEGTTDDRAGTRIQDEGLAASPYGDEGGVGPGEIGNYLVTAHRLTAGGPLRDLPSLDTGDPVLVTAGGVVHEYRITETRKTSFRSERSLTEQRAAVPGRPGERPTKAMITLSTCATPEDNAAGNFWRDDRGNPEHRIDKIGVLVSSKPTADAPNTP